MYGGGDRYSSGSQAPSRYQTRQAVPYQEQATYVEEPADNNQRRQDSGFQDPGFAIPFRSDFSFSEFGSPFGNPEGFQQFLSGLGNGGNQAPSDFSQQSAPQFPNLGGLNQRRSDNEGQRRPGQNQFKREVPGGQNVRPGGQVARQLDRWFESEKIRQ